MRNWIQTAVIGAVVAWSGGAASALDTQEDNPSAFATFGACGIIIEVDSGTEFAVVAMVTQNSLMTFSGGGYWSGEPATGQNEITVEEIESCLAAEAGTVTSLTQKGADAAAFATQEYMGFSFTLTEAAGGLDAGYHPYYIGTPPAQNSTAQTPAAEFEAAEEEITQVLTAVAQRSLNSTITSNTRLTRAARDRFLKSRAQMQADEAGIASRNQVAFALDGFAKATAEQQTAQGNFFAQNGNFEGTKRRLVFGDFDVQRDSDTGSTTATLNGKIAWEQMLSEQTMLGYYLGGEVALSNIRGSFTGNQDKYGLSVGGYFVHALQESVFLEGFASLGAGRNNLEMADDTLGLTSDYTTRTATLGAALSGVIEQDGYDILPELSFTYGKTFIGDVAFTGTAYGLVDNTLSLDAGDVSTATLMFRPEFRFALDGQKTSASLSTLSFAPRLICEQQKVGGVTSDNCGGGAELGVTSSTADGLTSTTTKLVADRVGNSTRSSLQFQLEHKF